MSDIVQEEVVAAVEPAVDAPMAVENDAAAVVDENVAADSAEEPAAIVEEAAAAVVADEAEAIDVPEEKAPVEADEPQLPVKSPVKSPKKASPKKSSAKKSPKKSPMKAEAVSLYVWYIRSLSLVQFAHLCSRLVRHRQNYRVNLHANNREKERGKVFMNA
jgi:cell division septation protein DedD